MKKYELIVTTKCELFFNRGLCKSKIKILNDNYHGVNFNIIYNETTNENNKEITFYWKDKLLL